MCHARREDIWIICGCKEKQRYLAISISVFYKNTFADAALSIGTITPEGTITWDQADTTEVKQGTEYTWTFTPGDSANYETLTGKITLWEKTANTTGNGVSDGKDDGTKGNTPKDNGTKGNATTTARNAAKTGDTAPLALFWGLGGISMAALLYLAGRKRKTQGNR